MEHAILAYNLKFSLGCCRDCKRDKSYKTYFSLPEEPNNAESFIETVRVHNPASSTCNSTPTAFQVTLLDLMDIDPKNLDRLI